ncbi:AI-2E family transporter [Mesobacillus zeae]|uniref:AI-2E family transporter n=1 Tax=Mesobacillus zeae TaxID=1917180 RepID=A0A398B1E4_9BACI|nr:AI-2E family transporter [Mesobacillus zeae]RID83749.1 AI-2E family transporter [Mesobacillus zeae]
MDIRMKWFYRLGFLLLLFAVIYTFLKIRQVWIPAAEMIGSLIVPFFVGAFITYLLHPVVDFLHQKGLHRGIAVFIIYTLFFSFTGYGIYKGIPLFISQLEDLSENAPIFAAQYREWIESIEHQTSSWPGGVHERIDEFIAALENSLDNILGRIISILLSLMNSIVSLAVIPFIAFYMLKDHDQIKKAAWYMSPKSWREPGQQFLRDVDLSLGRYIRGQLLVCLAIGTISALLFSIAGMPYAVLLGVIVGITNVIPYFGPVIGAIPAVIIAATISIKLMLTCAIIVFTLQFIEGNILSPLIVGKSIHMHPLIIMFALLAGGQAGGIAGMVLAVPIVVILRAAIVHARDHLVAAKRKQAT